MRISNDTPLSASPHYICLLNWKLQVVMGNHSNGGMSQLLVTRLHRQRSAGWSSAVSQSSQHYSGPSVMEIIRGAVALRATLWAINEWTGPLSSRERRLIIGDCSQYRCTDLSHAQMTVIWSRRNTGLSEERRGRGLVLFFREDGCSSLLLAFHYNSLLMSNSILTVPH